MGSRSFSISGEDWMDRLSASSFSFDTFRGLDGSPSSWPRLVSSSTVLIVRVSIFSYDVFCVLLIVLCHFGKPEFQEVFHAVEHPPVFGVVLVEFLVLLLKMDDLRTLPLQVEREHMVGHFPRFGQSDIHGAD